MMKDKSVYIDTEVDRHSDRRKTVRQTDSRLKIKIYLTSVFHLP